MNFRRGNINRIEYFESLSISNLTSSVFIGLVHGETVPGAILLLVLSFNVLFNSFNDNGAIWTVSLSTLLSVIFGGVTDNIQFDGVSVGML